MRPGDTFYPVITVKNSTTGAPVTGLLTANFAVAYYHGTTTPTASFTVTELSLGRYRVNLVLPATAGFLNAFVTAAGYDVENGRLQGEIEEQDLDSVYALVVRPIAQTSGTSAIASEVQLEINSRRYTELTVSIVDQSGAPIDMSGYNNWRFNVWTRTHSGSVYSLATGIVGTAGGVVTWSIPEDAAFNSEMDTAILLGDSSVTLFYDMIADKAATLAKTQSVFRGHLVINRWEGTA